MPSSEALHPYTLAVRAAQTALHQNLTSPPQLPSPLSTTHRQVVSLLTPSLTTSTTPALSVLLIGPSSSGKSLLFTHVLDTLNSTNIHPRLVHLHGLLHTSPTSAWRAVAAQLSPDLHPPTAQSECLALIEKQVHRLRKEQTPLLLVFDKFERFVNTDPLTQNVLYALFNLLQDAALCAACVAMTTSIDVADGLEKRVKSRFAAREIIIPLPRTVEVMKFLEQAVKSANQGERGTDLEDDRIEFDDGIDEFHHTACEFIAMPQCRQLVTKCLYRSRIVAPITRAVVAALARAFEEGEDGEVQEKPREDRLDIAITELETWLLPPDPRVDLMDRLTAAEVALLVALKKVEARKAGKVCFGDVFKEYGTLGSGGEGFLTADDGEATMGLDVADKCWQRLAEAGLVARVGHGPKYMRGVALEVAADEVDRLVQRHPAVTTRMQMWARGGRG